MLKPQAFGVVCVVVCVGTGGVVSVRRVIQSGGLGALPPPSNRKKGYGMGPRNVFSLWLIASVGMVGVSQIANGDRDSQRVSVFVVRRETGHAGFPMRLPGRVEWGGQTFGLGPREPTLRGRRLSG
ncbi:hypothetical protein Poly24_38640 [Rosistilla carotiformis]|uniref:Uncharacterized protein n=1 Tax=Rosistilla carotiformis TaxID=2528017 RepID=A0A518JX86_9BACT|nr:hypothetical protein Poly24_38640 [Rosistilla carotiformis]